MSLRSKLLLAFIVVGLAPLLAVGALGYLGGGETVEALLREWAKGRVERLARRVEQTIVEHENRLMSVASVESLGEYVRGARPEMPAATRAHLVGLFEDGGDQFEVITGLKAGGATLFRVVKGADGRPRVETEDFATPAPRYEEGVWRATRPDPLRSPPSQEKNYGSCLRTTVPVFAGEGAERPVVGVLVLEMRLKEVLKDADEPDAGGATGPPATVLALDNASGALLFHTIEPYVYSQTPMPYFEAVAAKMRAGGNGHDSFVSPEGDRWFVVYRQVDGLSVSLAAAVNYTTAAAGVRRAALWGGGLALAAAGVALILVIMAPHFQKKPGTLSLPSEGGSQEDGKPAPGAPPRGKVFVSYSRPDIKWLNELQKYLAPLENENIVLWDDTRISPGQD